MMNKLFLDPQGRFSTSKMWTQIAYTVATIIMLITANSMSWEMLLAYLGGVGGSEVAKKYLTMRYGNPHNGS
jgi:hypothetical protein